MRAENFKPGTIPYYEDLETLADRSFDALQTGMISDIRYNGIYRDIDADPEFLEILQPYADRIATEYIAARRIYDPDVQERLGSSTHLSMYIGVAISRRLQGAAEWGMDFGSVAKAMEEGTLYQYMTVATNQYMLHRPQLYTVLAHGLELLLEQVHDSRGAGHARQLGEIAAQLTLMHTEEYYLRMHIEAMARKQNFDDFEAQFDD